MERKKGAVPAYWRFIWHVRQITAVATTVREDEYSRKNEGADVARKAVDLKDVVLLNMHVDTNFF